MSKVNYSVSAELECLKEDLNRLVSRCETLSNLYNNSHSCDEKDLEENKGGFFRK